MLVPIFDELGAAAKRTLPKYRPRGYSHDDSDEEDLIRKAVKKEVPDAEVLAVGLVPVLDRWVVEVGAVWLVHVARRFLPARVRAFVDLARQRFASEKPWLEATRRLP